MRRFSFQRHRFPADIIRHAIRLYARITLSYRDVEERLAERDLGVSEETARGWFLKFGSTLAATFMPREPAPTKRPAFNGLLKENS